MKHGAIIVLLFLCLFSCTQDPSAPDNMPAAPTVSYDKENMTRVSVMLTATYGADVEDVRECGFVVNDKQYSLEVPPDRQFSYLATIEPGRDYKVTSYYSNGRDRRDSKEIISFTALSDSPPTVSDVTYSDGKLKATIIDDGGSDIVEVGFCWGEQDDKRVIKRAQKYEAETETSFTRAFTVQEPGTYYILAYAENANERMATGYSSRLLEVMIEEEDIKPIPVSSIVLDPVECALKVGETQTITATILPEYATDKTIIWTTSNPEIAIVENGVVTAVGLGACTITAAAGDKSAVCEVSVNPIEVSGISLNPSECTLFIGETQEIHASVLPADATDKTVTWNTDNPEVATVKDGVVTAVGVGNCTITATAGEASAGCQVTVMPISVASIELSLPSCTITIGGIQAIEVTILPENATDKTVTWSTDNPEVATVEDGVITAVGVGSCVITAKSGGKSVTCAVEVKPIEVTGLSLIPSECTLFMGETQELQATVLPEDATDKTVMWSTSDPNIATVTDGVITAVGLGACTITATAGDKSAVCEVLVNPIEVTGVSLNPSECTLFIGETQELQATVLPVDATDKTVMWSTVDPKIATVTDGVITAVGLGTCTITATAGAQSASCSVTVNPIDVVSVTLNLSECELSIGETQTLTATVLPADATDKSVVWSTDNPDVATVEAGVVTAVGVGSCAITATSGGKSVTCNVKVNPIEVTGISLNPSECTLFIGETQEIHASVFPFDATDKTITWSSNNTNVAVVKDGVVTALGVGNCTITAVAGRASTKCQVTVMPITVASIELSQTLCTMTIGETQSIGVTILPENATDKTVIWSTDNPAVATVKDGVVTAVGAGNCRITASSGGISALCQVTVMPIAVESIELSLTSCTMNIGETQSIGVIVFPENATDKTVIWSTDNSEVATAEDGVVTAVGGGSCTITATAGFKTASCTVTVIVPVTWIRLNKETESIPINGTTILVATVLPPNASDKTVVWRSDDELVATVSQAGLVSGIGRGVCTVTAMIGDYSASCEVDVGAIELNAVNFPDEQFRSYLSANVDNNKDGFLSYREIEVCTYVNVNEMSIHSLEGIQYFNRLYALYCSNNQLTELDVSNLTALTVLSCHDNKLTGLDLTNLTSLTKLYCHNNHLSTLDIVNLTSLTILWCFNNQLTTLDVSNLTSLTDLECSYNKLNALDLTNLASLTHLYCYNNQLTILDIASLTSLTKLWCFNNQITTLDVSNLTSLKDLDCSDNKLTVLDVNNLTFLTNLSCGKNQLTTIDVSKLTALKDLVCYGNQLTELDLTNLTSLTQLNCGNNQLATLDVSNLTSLTFLDCSDNKLTALDVNNLTFLTNLYCGNNQLTALDVSKLTALKDLYCYDNQLTTLDLSTLTSLTRLHCDNNQFTELDVSTLTALTDLWCFGNQLTALDVTHSTSLERLLCDYNQLTMLDVSNCHALYVLECRSNPYLTEIILGVGQVIQDFRYDTAVATIKYKD